MKKQYVVTFKNINPRLSQTLRYLTEVKMGYAYKTTEIKDAKVFRTKAEAREEIANIERCNLYHIDVNIVSI